MRQEDCLSPGVQDQSGQHSETPSSQKLKKLAACSGHSIFIPIKCCVGQARWLMPVILALWEAKAVGSPELLRKLRRENDLNPGSGGSSDMAPNLTGTKLILVELNNTGLAQWLTPVTPTLWENKAGRSLEVRSFEMSLANMGAQAGESPKPGRWRMQWVEIAPLHSSLGDR
ncbi:hypothetical protein AAY473_039467, partial [Plecturocebus cupreus]